MKFTSAILALIAFAIASTALPTKVPSPDCAVVGQPLYSNSLRQPSLTRFQQLMRILEKMVLTACSLYT